MKKKIKNYIKNFLRKLGLKLIKINTKKPKAFPYTPPTIEGFKCLQKSTGIFHFGAHRGSEAAVYEWFGKKVLWVEALPDIFIELKDNIHKHYQQKAICAVLGDEDKKKIDFYLSTRDQASSSMFDFSSKIKNNEIFKDHGLKMTNVIKLEMRTLDSLLSEHNISASNYDHWVVDLQGAEIKFLKGATASLKYCKSINIEVSQIEVYSGGAKWLELKKFLELKNFNLIEEPTGDHIDVLFVKNNDPN